MFQQLINFLYRHPKSELRKFKRFGGYFNYRKMIRSRKLMDESSLNLTPAISNPEGLLIHFLTGKKYLYQTLYCIQSLTKVTTTKFKFVLVDDGSLDDSMLEQINYQLPGAEIVTKLMIEKNLRSSLPEHLYPYLNQKRKVYPHIKKLTDVHTIPGNTWKLVLDSDMLFWSEPKQMIAWLRNPENPIHMVDCEESYGYSYELMEEVCGFKIRALINVGAIGLNSGQVNWNNIEKWTEKLEEKEGVSYYLEQALTAMIIGNCNSEILNSQEYVVNPSPQMIIRKWGVLHHYVDLSKQGYFKNAWKTI